VHSFQVPGASVLVNGLLLSILQLELKSYTPKPDSYIINYKPQTLNPKPSTLNL